MAASNSGCGSGATAAEATGSNVVALRLDANRWLGALVGMCMEPADMPVRLALNGTDAEDAVVERRLAAQAHRPNAFLLTVYSPKPWFGSVRGACMQA